MEGPFTTTGTPPELAATSFAKGRDCNTDRRAGISRHRLVLSSFHVFVTVNNCYSNHSKASVSLFVLIDFTTSAMQLTRTECKILAP